MVRDSESQGPTTGPSRGSVSWATRAAKQGCLLVACTGAPRSCLSPAPGSSEQPHLPRGPLNQHASLEGVTQKQRGDKGRGRRKGLPPMKACVPEWPLKTPRSWLLGREFPKSRVGSQIKSRIELRQLLVWGLFLINSSLAHAESALSLPPGSSSPMHI